MVCYSSFRLNYGMVKVIRSNGLLSDVTWSTCKDIPLVWREIQRLHIRSFDSRCSCENRGLWIIYRTCCIWHEQGSVRDCPAALVEQLLFSTSTKYHLKSTKPILTVAWSRCGEPQCSDGRHFVLVADERLKASDEIKGGGRGGESCCWLTDHLPPPRNLVTSPQSSI